MLYRNKKSGFVIRPDQYNKLALNDRYYYDEMTEKQVDEYMGGSTGDGLQPARRDVYNSSVKHLTLNCGISIDKVDDYIKKYHIGTVQYDYLVIKEREEKAAKVKTEKVETVKEPDILEEGVEAEDSDCIEQSKSYMWKDFLEEKEPEENKKEVESKNTPSEYDFADFRKFLDEYNYDVSVGYKTVLIQDGTYSVNGVNYTIQDCEIVDIVKSQRETIYNTFNSMVWDTADTMFAKTPEPKPSKRSSIASIIKKR